MYLRIILFLVICRGDIISFAFHVSKNCSNHTSLWNEECLVWMLKVFIVCHDSELWFTVQLSQLDNNHSENNIDTSSLGCVCAFCYPLLLFLDAFVHHILFNRIPMFLYCPIYF